MVNHIVNGHNTVYVTKSSKALEKGIDSVFFSSTVKKPPQAVNFVEIC